MAGKPSSMTLSMANIFTTAAISLASSLPVRMPLPKNLITGTRYLNVDGMLPFENMVADYIKETENHVLYRVTPVFRDDELVARGVLIEAKSVEDNGDGILFCVYAYNNQPGVEIDYLTGESREST